MFNFLTRFLEKKHPLKSLEDVRRDLQAERTAEGRRIAARFTRGNIAIQLGRMTTSLPASAALHPRIKNYLKK